MIEIIRSRTADGWEWRVPDTAKYREHMEFHGDPWFFQVLSAPDDAIAAMKKKVSYLDTEAIIYFGLEGVGVVKVEEPVLPATP